MPKNGLFKIGPDDLLYHLLFFNTVEELKLPIKGPMEDAGVIKLYEPSPTPCLYVAPVEKKKFLLHSHHQLAENRHVMCIVEKAGFEPRTLGTGAERATNCATAPVAPVENIMGRVPLIPLFLAGNSTPTVPYCYNKCNYSGFPMGGLQKSPAMPASTDGAGVEDVGLAVSAAAAAEAPSI